MRYDLGNQDGRRDLGLACAEAAARETGWLPDNVVDRILRTLDEDETETVILPLSDDAMTIVRIALEGARADAEDAIAVCRHFEAEAGLLPQSETYQAGQRLATCQRLIDLFEHADNFRLLAEFTARRQLIRAIGATKGEGR